ncbi:MAG TPA: Na+/H+ antiporter [Candidatus Saccharimonadales bacterium]|nr:Na+/H+ antiporter [Candidatus Saccharimonadales bacterium]
MMERIQVVLGLLTAVAALAVLARRIRIPVPILLVIGGLILALIPGIPKLRLDPEMVFLLFLPPLLYPAALFTPWRDFRENLRPILLLAVGLVLFTTVTVAFLAHKFIADLPLAAAFVLGAIVSPTDAIAATSIAQRLRIPRRIIAIVEGESLVNDATALVAYQFAVGAVLTGSFSLAKASGQFVIVSAGGILFGLLVGLVSAWILERLDDTPIQITVSLLIPFAAYLPAERMGISGVLAVVAAGFYHGWRSPEMVSARMRLQAAPVWEMIEFLLNGFIFIVIGLQLPGVLQALSGRPLPELFRQAAGFSVVVILIRVVWVFAATYLPRLLSERIRKRDPFPSWRSVTIMAWTGMRGVVSLAAALALPAVIQNGQTFPARELIVFLTFAVILATLVAQGLSLPPLIRLLHLRQDRRAEREEYEARLKANHAALARIDGIAGAESVDPATLQRLRIEYEDRIRQLEDSEREDSEKSYHLFSQEYERLSHAALQAERQVILKLRNDSVINDDVLRRIQRDIDLADARLRYPDKK